MAKTRVCVVESQLTAREFTFDYEDGDGLKAGLRRVMELDGQGCEEAEGNYNWMTGPFPSAPGDGHIAMFDLEAEEDAA